MQLPLTSMVLALMLAGQLFSQTHHHEHDMKMDSSDMTAHHPHSSGTSVLPESSPMRMAMYHSGGWMFMLHGSAFVRYTNQGGLRGGHKLDAPNWGMVVAEREIETNGSLRLSAMLSLDPLTEGSNGYPLLFQTGESSNGTPLIDRQHPHDLFSELSVFYRHNFSGDVSAFVYGGCPGEPALGPPAFMHRPSAMYLPDAPIAHHWQDATHITFGVATGGITIHQFTLEGSAFNGTEPDENRYNFDTPQFSSFSGRISYAPTKEIALQFSNGYLKNPENNGRDVHRTTASVLYSREHSGNNSWSSAIVWGENRDATSGAQESLLLESAFTFMPYVASGRIELVQKTRRELGIAIDADAKETLTAFALGVSRVIWAASGLDMLGGVMGMMNIVPSGLRQFYGATPVSFELFLQIVPARRIAAAMH